MSTDLGLFYIPPSLPPSFPPSLPPSAFQEAFQEFQTLEDRITYVATKVVHLGDQLESSNNRRMRAVEARELMKYLDEFRTRARPNISVFTDPGRVSVYNVLALVPGSPSFHTISICMTLTPPE